MKKIILFLSITVIFSSLLFGELDKRKSNTPLAKTAVTSDIYMNANRMNGIMRNNGTWLYDNPAGTWGLEWPKGSGNSPVYAGGQWIGARVNGEVTVSGVVHDNTEYQPGVIESPGVASNFRDSQYRWYTLRTGGVGDWANWPVDQGAPVDADGNPLLLGDMSAFCIWNDLAPHTQFGSNGRLNAEIRQFVWQYNRADALGDMMFMKYTIVNKGNANWDDTYFTIWSDPDIGNGNDDFVACDTTLGLGICYNATNDDQQYGAAPPALGFDFFQGPIVKEEGSQVVLPDGTTLDDTKMLKMTSFVYYNNNDNIVNGNPDFANEAYNLQRGIWKNGIPITEGGTGVEFPNNPQSSFMFSGDPVSGTGWNDSNEDDRRFIMTTGPFNMTYWEANNSNKDLNMNGMPDFGEPGVQEIVIGIIVARGTDNLNSVAKLKEVDKLAQLAYDVDFNLASAPAVPEVSVVSSSNVVTLAWTEISELLEDGISPYESIDPIIEKAMGDTVIMDNVVKEVTDDSYNFYGYSVYQYADAGGRNPVQINHWDNGGTADANPYTNARFLRITQNKNGEVDLVGNNLVNGKAYYFGVVAEGYCEFGAPTVLESAVDILTVIPHETLGLRTQSAFGDTLIFAEVIDDTTTDTTASIPHFRVDESLPMSDGSCMAWVVDPNQLTGHGYEVRFSDDGNNGFNWHLINTATQDTVLKDQKNQRGDDAYNVVDGLLVKPMGPTAGLHGVFLTSNADGPTEGINEAANENALWVTWNVADWPGWGTGMAGNHGQFFVTHGGGDQDYDTFLARVFRNNNWAEAQANVYEMRFTADGGQVWNRYVTGNLNDVPFELWCLGPNPEDTSDDYRMIGWTNDDNGNDIFDFHGDDLHSGGANDPTTDWIYWGTPSDMTPGSAGYEADVADGFANWSGHEVIARSRLMNWNCSSSYEDTVMIADFPHNTTDEWDATDTTFMTDRGWFLDADNDLGVATVVGDTVFGLVLENPEIGTVYRWVTNKPNSDNDYFVFDSPDAKTETDADQKVDLDKILVVPNPYYGYHSGEMNIFQRWVQFTNLPAECTIRIFDLAGNQLKKLEKNDPTTTFEQWDLSNQYGLPVASGIYVYHVDIPGVGEKIGKLALFAPNERMDTY